MDALFAISEVERSTFLHYIIQHLQATYICLWFYTPPPSNCFSFFDGFYLEESNLDQPSSSSGSLARRLFDQYRAQQLIATNHNCVPGIAYKNKSPYLEMKELELQRVASLDAQRLFYQAARIQTAVFMGCTSGEIEIGWSSNVNQMNTQNEMKNWFPDDFSIMQSPRRELSSQIIAEPSRHSSSSSSLRSLSMDSPDSTPLLFNIPPPHQPQSLQDHNHLHFQALMPNINTTNPLQELIQSTNLHPSTSTPISSFPFLPPFQQIPTTTPTTTIPPRAMIPFPTTTNNPLQQESIFQSLQPNDHQSIASTHSHRQAMQQFSLTRNNVRLPTTESEEALMANAILAVLTSPPPSASSSSSSSHQAIALQHTQGHDHMSAFKNYRSSPSSLAPTTTPSSMRRTLQRKSMLKRAVSYYRSMNIARHEQFLANRPTANLHHMISERKRREKINDSFQALRTLLPPETKKDKASVLTRTREYLSTLKGQVEELSRKNQQLQAQLLKGSNNGESSIIEPPRERVGVEIIDASGSTSDGRRVVDMQVSVRGDTAVGDVVIRLLEFLKQVRDVSLASIEADTHALQTASFSRVILRLNVEGNEWDESGFQEAVRRVVEDLAQ